MMTRGIILHTISFAALVITSLLPSAWCLENSKWAIAAQPLASVQRIHNAVSTQKLSHVAETLEQLMYKLRSTNELQSVLGQQFKDVRGDTECHNATHFFFESLLRKKPWAMSVFDAMGKPESGFEDGNIFWQGSYEECVHHIHTNTSPFSPKYCWVKVGPPSNNPTHYGINIGLCVSDKCNTSQVMSGAMQVLEDLRMQKQMSVLFGECQDEKVYDWRAFLAITILSIFAIIISIGTLYDIYVFRPAVKNILINADNVVESEAIEAAKEGYTHQQGKLVQVLVAFSLRANFIKLVSIPKISSKGQLPALHGIRFLSLAWVILGHTYAFPLGISDNIITVLGYIKSFTFQAVLNGTFSVDSFFFLSGLLTTYLFMREMEKSGKVSLAMFYFHRIWRLTPLYMVVLMIDTCLVRYFTTGAPFWPAQGFEVDYCKDTWWTNLLYINNFVTDILPGKTMCMGWSWYLANDMQFHIISPIILYPLVRSKKLGAAIASVLLIAAITTSAVISSNRHFIAAVYDPNKPNANEDAQNLLYFRPWAHFGCFVVGVAIGYLIHKTDIEKIRLNKYTVAICWCLAIACNVTVLYGVYSQYHGTEWSNAVNALYLATSRTMWAVGLGWLAFACIFGYAGFINKILSLSVWIPLSRLTYSAYLVHPIIMFVYIVNLQVPVHVTHFTMIMMYLAFMVASYATAAVFSLCFESPLMQLEKVLFPRATSGRQKSKVEDDGHVAYTEVQQHGEH